MKVKVIQTDIKNIELGSLYYTNFERHLSVMSEYMPMLKVLSNEII